MEKKFLILHADADENNRLEIVTLLEHIGVVVEEAKTGYEALKLINASSFDVIIVDYMLPDYNGIALIPLIRNISDTPVIVITSNGDETLAVKAIKYGAVDYIPRKNITPETLNNAIEEATHALQETNSFKIQRINDIEELKYISQSAKIRCLVA